MRFIHTADWQVGKPFRQFGDREPLLRQARLNVIETIGRLALREGALHVLVAGDIYDTDSPTHRTLREPLERMRALPSVQWHLLPGNHDPHRPQGLWDRVRAGGVPENVHLHLTAEPFALDGSATLLPAPLTRRSESTDLTAWMDRAETGPGQIRIGLAHGSVTGFSSESEASNPVDPRRPEMAGLAYLALGDWHRTVRIGDRLWYAGTPEPDRAGSQEIGQVLLVDSAGPGAVPLVTQQDVGTYRWLDREARMGEVNALDDLESGLRSLSGLSSTLLRLRLSGTLPLAQRIELDRRLQDLTAAMFNLQTDLEGLLLRPTAADLEEIDFGGVLRQAADRLKAMVDDGAGDAAHRRHAEQALIELFIRVSRAEAPP